MHSWQQAHQLLLLVYKYTDSFPPKEIYKLTSQIRSAAVSITSNIAEGFGRKSYKEKLQFYSIAMGSLIEVQNQLFISKGVQYLSQEGFDHIYRQSIRVHKLLNGLMKKTKTVIRNS